MSTATTVEAGRSLVEVKVVAREHLNYVWRVVEEFVVNYGQRMLEFYDLPELYTEIQNGLMDLWVVVVDGQIKVVGLCGVERHVKKFSYHVYWVGGTGFLKCRRQAIRQVEEYAKIVGASCLFITGRPGWVRAMEKDGYVVDTYRLRKDLE